MSDATVILEGAAVDVLKDIPDESIDMCITSPPYWALRDYGVDGQLGREHTVEDYIDNLCSVFDEVRRVLKTHGTCWVNIGDTYLDKCLLQIPYRFSMEMINRGWILRNEIVWHKSNCIPTNVKDRFTIDFEKLFFFTKSKKYLFAQQFEPTNGKLNHHVRDRDRSKLNNTPGRSRMGGIED